MKWADRCCAVFTFIHFPITMVLLTLFGQTINASHLPNKIMKVWQTFIFITFYSINSLTLIWIRFYLYFMRNAEENKLFSWRYEMLLCWNCPIWFSLVIKTKLQVIILIVDQWEFLFFFITLCLIKYYNYLERVSFIFCKKKKKKNLSKEKFYNWIT